MGNNLNADLTAMEQADASATSAADIASGAVQTDTTPTDTTGQSYADQALAYADAAWQATGGRVLTDVESLAQGAAAQVNDTRAAISGDVVDVGQRAADDAAAAAKAAATVSAEAAAGSAVAGIIVAALVVTLVVIAVRKGWL